MRTIRGQVKCEMWDRPEDFEAEVEDDATEEEIEDAMRQAAIETAKFEFWRVDGK